MNALDIFRLKQLTYIEIGEILGMHESEVEKIIHKLREEEHARREKRMRLGRPKVPYAGKERNHPAEWAR